MSNGVILKAEGIHKSYKNGKRDLRVLRGIEMEVKRGETVAIVGPSGAGKSTLLHIMGGLDAPSAGKVIVEEEEIYSLSDTKRAQIRNNSIGFVFQFYHLLPEFTALENTMMPALLSRPRRMRNRRKIREVAMGLLTKMGLSDRTGHTPQELSGGEQQRVAIARALINEPRILFCDEPTGNLDSEMGEEVLERLFNINREEGTTIIMVTHDRDIAGRFAVVKEIRDGVIVS